MTTYELEQRLLGLQALAILIEELKLRGAIETYELNQLIGADRVDDGD